MAGFPPSGLSAVVKKLEFVSIGTGLGQCNCHRLRPCNFVGRGGGIDDEIEAAVPDAKFKAIVPSPPSFAGHSAIPMGLEFPDVLQPSWRHSRELVPSKCSSPTSPPYITVVLGKYKVDIVVLL